MDVILDAIFRPLFTAITEVTSFIVDTTRTVLDHYLYQRLRKRFSPTASWILTAIISLLVALPLTAGVLIGILYLVFYVLLPLVFR